MTVREVLTAKIQRLQQRKQALIKDAQNLQAEIDALQAERAALTTDHENLCARLQALGVLKAED